MTTAPDLFSLFIFGVDKRQVGPNKNGHDGRIMIFLSWSFLFFLIVTVTVVSPSFSALRTRSALHSLPLFSVSEL